MSKLIWQPAKMPSLKGKVAVVTGANSGIGLHTAKHLALHGAKVYFTARSEAKAQHVRDVILVEDPKLPVDRLSWLKMDLMDVQSVLDAAAEVRSKEDKVDILSMSALNNAGYMSDRVDTTKNGWEYGMAVNHFGPYILTMALMSLLKTAASAPDSDVRIVNTCSRAHRGSVPANFPLDFSSPALWDGSLPYEPWQWRYVGSLLFKSHMVRYGISKLTLAMLTRDLQRRLDAAGIPVICVSPHPGGVASPGLHEHARPWFIRLVQSRLLSEYEGSWHQLFIATDPAVRRDADRFKGRYCEEIGQSHPGHALLGDDGACRKVWENTTKQVDSYLAEAGLQPLPSL